MIVARLIALAALASQVVAISDQLLVAHVTCPVDGNFLGSLAGSNGKREKTEGAL